MSDERGWSKEVILSILRECAGDIGESPSEPQYSEWRTGLKPSSCSIINQFGSWNKAKEEAGLRTYGRGVHHPNYRLADKPRSECSVPPEEYEEAIGDE